MEVPSIGTVVIVGFGMVLAILILLVLILSAEGAIFKSIDKKKAEKARAVAQNAAVVPAPAPVPAQAAPVIESGIPEEVVAAIVAAVSAMGDGKYTLRSLSRVKGGRSPWNVAATVSYTQPF